VATTLVWAVPAVELLAAGLLLARRVRRIGFLCITCFNGAVYNLPCIDAGLGRAFACFLWRGHSLDELEAAPGIQLFFIGIT